MKGELEDGSLGLVFHGMSLAPSIGFRLCPQQWFDSQIPFEMKNLSLW